MLPKPCDKKVNKKMTNKETEKGDKRTRADEGKKNMAVILQWYIWNKKRKKVQNVILDLVSKISLNTPGFVQNKQSFEKTINSNIHQNRDAKG